MDWVENIDNKLVLFLHSFNPWTRVYSVARSIIALSELLTLSLNKITIFFPYTSAYFNDTTSKFSIFHLLGFNNDALILGKTICILVLLAVISGFFPQITSLLHYWVAFSIQASMIVLDGGEQVCVVLSLLLIPIALTDNRINAWYKPKKDDRLYSNYFKIISLVFYWALRFQVFFIYFDALVQKLYIKEWINGTSLYYFFNDYLITMPSFFHRVFAFILNSQLIAIPTYGTLIAECLLTLAIFTRQTYWKYFFALGFLLHLMFAIIIGLFSFSMIMIGALVIYLVPLNHNFEVTRTLYLRGLGFLNRIHDRRSFQ